LHTAEHISSTGDKVILLNATGLGYQVMRALGRRGVRSIVIYDQESEEIGRYSRYVADCIEVPRFVEQPERLLVYLLEKGRKWSGTLIIPTKDYGVEFLARYKDILSRYYIIPTPGLDVIEGILDKRILYENAHRLGIAVPGTFHARSLEDLRRLKDIIEFPCLLKPGRAHVFIRRFGFKMLEIECFEQLAGAYRDLTGSFTGDAFGMMICEIIPGPDSEQMVQFASYIDRSGEMLASMTSRKMRQDPPKYGQGRVTKSERVTDVDEQSRRLLKELGYHGFSEIEWKYDPRDGEYKLIEINPRFIFYTALCTSCGINFPYIEYADLVLHEKIRAHSFRENVYWVHLYKDLLHTVLNHAMERLSIREYLRPYLGRMSFAIFDPRDPRPFFEEWREHVGNMLKRRIRTSK
jgi:predicted ATP-grasp superfamily ATP-dependent carboligase